MTRSAHLVLLLLLGACASSGGPWLPAGRVRLVEVARSDRRWTGIAVSKAGRIFVNYPLWSADQPFAVGELGPGGAVTPYPDVRLNSWEPGKDPGEHLVCVQALHVDTRDRLWILDPANPRFEGVVPGGPKLVCVDLGRDRVRRVYRFGPEAAPPDAYLNDVRVDAARGVAYLTDSGNGALVVLDLRSGRARRLLDGHPATHAEDVVLTIGGDPWLRGGRAPRVHADGIALDADRRWLYFQALTARTLHRVACEDLLDETLDAAALAERVQVVARSGASDGLLFGPDGCVYVTALEHDAIRRVRPDGTVETVVSDPRIEWPDSFALDPGGSLLFTTARIHRQDGPFRVFRLERTGRSGSEQPGSSAGRSRSRPSKPPSSGSW